MSKFGSECVDGFYSDLGGEYERRGVEIVWFVDRGKERTKRR